MKLLCRPKGRGHWSIITIIVNGKRVPTPGFFDFYVGQVIRFGPMTLRVIGVEP